MFVVQAENRQNEQFLMLSRIFCSLCRWFCPNTPRSGGGPALALPFTSHAPFFQEVEPQSSEARSRASLPCSSWNERNERPLLGLANFDTCLPLPGTALHFGAGTRIPTEAPGRR